MSLLSLLTALGYFASLLMGVALGLTGGGGSILTVPILVYLFHQGALEATTYSLAIVGLVALWGAWKAFRSKEMHLVRALAFGVPGVIGVLVSRRGLLPMVPAEMNIGNWSINKNTFILLAFALIMLSAALSMIRSALQKTTLETNEKISRNLKVSPLFLGFGGLSVGIIAGFVGAGGGFLIVPALVNFGRLEMKQAVGTSLLVIALQSLFGILGDMDALLQLDWVLFGSISVLALFGMSLGTSLRKNIPPKKLKLGFGVFVFIMGIMVLIQELGKG